MSFDDIVRLGLSVGFQADSAYQMARIAWRESKGNPKAVAIVAKGIPGRTLPERSFGLWQVNVLAFPQYDEQLLQDPEYNAQAAYALSKGGTDLRPWRVR
jgi:hypothetical protein